MHWQLFKCISLTENDDVTQAVVCDLLWVSEKRGHIVHMNNYYSSPRVYKQLLMNGFGACGTVKVNRKRMPDE